MGNLRRFEENITLFLFGGTLYSLLEICFRGYTHWTMTITGGLCFVLLYRHYSRSKESMLAWCLYGTAVITSFEFAVGCVVNLICGWKVWDYSSQPFNIFGQVCLMFSALWFLLSIPAAWLCKAFGKKFSCQTPLNFKR